MSIQVRKTKKDKRIFFAVRDYYNVDGNPKESKRANEVALHITGRKNINLTEEERSDVRCIKENMKDMIYMVGVGV